MEIDTRFPTKLSSISDAPEPLRSALVASLPSGESARLLFHAPAFATEEEKTPATVLAVTNHGWLVVSETETGGATVEKSNFSDTLYLELKSILLLCQLRICFAAKWLYRRRWSRCFLRGTQRSEEALCHQLTCSA